MSMEDQPAAKSWGIAKATAYGGVLLRGCGEVLLREPSKHFDDYVWTFAKGRPEPGDAPEQTALREVLEETGYRAEIIGVLPGVFEGGTTTNAYFVMRPLGVPGRLDWETQAIRWVGLTEAAWRIKRTGNIKGRQRDLAVLAAAKSWWDGNRELVVDDEATAGYITAGDWDISGLPEQFTTVPLDFRLSAADSYAIRKGFKPMQQEDKWFAFFSGDTLFQHRSWSGFCIDQVHFVQHEDGLRATHAQVNRNPEHYSETDDAVDIERIESLVRDLAAHHQAAAQEPSVLSALTLASQPGYLGAPSTVQALMVELFDVALGVIAYDRKHEECVAKQCELARIMTEDGTGYVRMPGWHTEDQLGRALIERFDLNAEYCADEDLYFIVCESLASISLSLRALSNLQQVEDEGPYLFSDRVAQLLAFVCSVYLGTHTVSYPGKTLKDFVPTGGVVEMKSAEQTIDAPAPRLPPFKFAEMGLGPGTLLTFKLDERLTCTVVEANKVDLMGELMSLSNAAIKALKAFGRNPKAARGPDYWCYKGVTLTAYRLLTKR